VADAYGRFSLHSPYAQEQLRGEHLGYRVQDTTLLPSTRLRVQLMAAPLSLAEVEISDAPLI
ncbi:MAG TPA: hypothetical protein DCR93_03775, partial [Cytophagales bacterium]|nr:hypothetical protein [Cytophagales bacterium]